MRKCTSCGVELGADAAFCPHDGAPTIALTLPSVAKTLMSLPFAEGMLHPKHQEAAQSRRPSVPPPVERDDPLIGLVIDGRHRITRILGQGAMGVVYEAEHMKLGKKVAIKVLRERLVVEEKVAWRFFQEAQASSSIGHPNIVDVTDFGQCPDGTSYFVMEYLHGQTLGERLGHGPIAIEEAIAIARQIASALNAAHQKGIVHRDLKPDNIVLVPSGSGSSFVKILDFGVAQIGEVAKATRPELVFGTPYYMAPEQADGRAVDSRTDIYSLGVILYEMVTGRAPFDAPTVMELLSKHMMEAPRPPIELNPRIGDLNTVILRALAKAPDERFQSMGAFLEALAASELRPVSIPAPRRASITPEPPVAPAPTSFTWLYVLGGFMVLGLLGSTAVFVLGWARLEGLGESLRSPPLAAQPAAQAPATPPPPPPAPVRAPDMIRIETEPAGVSVTQDGIILGNTPFEIERPVGAEERLLELSHGELPQRTVKVTATSPALIRTELAAPPKPRAVRRRPSGPKRPPVSKPSSSPSSSPGGEFLDPWAQ